MKMCMENFNLAPNTHTQEYFKIVQFFIVFFFSAHIIMILA